MKRLQKLKLFRFRKAFSIILGTVFISITSSYWLIEQSAEEYMFQKVDSLPNNKVGLVLGTSKWLVSGKVNPFFQYRIDAAIELFQAGKVKYILVSGDNSTLAYNEPREMKKALIKAGIPDEAIYMDFAGFRTLDSIIRCKKVFGQSQFTVISQDFHARRAVFISRAEGIDAVAYSAKDVGTKAGLKVYGRELLARVKAMIDLFVIDKQPRFLGDPILIGQASQASL